MKIVFVLPAIKSPYSVCPEPSLGLAYLAACLLEYKNDLQIEIIDGFLLGQDEYIKKISNIKADIVGVSTTMSQLNQALMIPHMMKEKGTKFIISVSGIANIPSSKLYESGYSIICSGEGKKTVIELALSKQLSRE